MLTLVLVAPYFPLLWDALTGAPPMYPVWDVKAQSTFWSSALLCVLVSALGLALATATLVLLWLAKSRALRLTLHGCLLLLFALSPVIQLAGWREYGFASALPALAAAALMLAWKYFPLMVWLSLASLHQRDAAAFEAARLVTAGWLPLGRLLLPMLTPALLSSAAIAAALVFLESEVPPLLGLDVYASDYLGRLALDPNASAAMLAALPFLVVALVVVMVAVGLRAVARPGPGGGGLVALDACRPGIAGASPLAALAAVVLLAPLLALVPAAVTAGIMQADASDFEALRESCYLDVAAALPATALSYTLAECLTGAAREMRAVLLVVIGICMFVPGALTGIAIAQLAVAPALGEVLQGNMPLIVAHTLRLVPIGTLLLLALLWMEPAALREELQLTGAGWLAVQRLVRLPMHWPGVVAVFGLLLVLALSELSSTILVVAPGTETVILRLYNLMHYGAGDAVAFLALAQAVLTAAIVIGVFFLTKRGLRVADRGA
jgi:iron(III) transport system permease protein